MFAIVFALTACGGGNNFSGGSNGSNPPPPPPPDVGTAEGLWEGMSTAGRTVGGLVLQDGSYWFHYSSAGNNAILGGIYQGSGVSNNGNFTSTNGVDVNFEGAGANTIQIAGSYIAKSQLSETITYPSNKTGKLTTTYNRDYELTPNFSLISGHYSGNGATNAGLAAVDFLVASGGAIAGTVGTTCSFNGAATTSVRGNVYEISLSFTGSGCSNGSSTVTGVAYFVSAERRLVATALNAGRTDGLVLDATK